MSTDNPLQQLANAQAIAQAEAKFRMAQLFTPYGFVPERQDFDRMNDFLDNPYRAFPAPTDAIKASLDRTVARLREATLMLQALGAQGVNPTLTDDQLFTTAKANVTNPMMARAA